jgi:uncharacterized membrane protein
MIGILTLAAVAMIYSQLLGKHYYRLTYATCQAGAVYPLCAVWRRESIFEVVAIVLIAIAAWIYNDRRSIGQ